jgi:NhaP-type Na+/H+ or K+/H+ antiporter
VAAVCIVVIFITYLIHRIAGRKKYAKYIPSVIFLLLGIYNIYMINSNPGEGFDDLIKALYLFVCATCFISGIGAGLFIDFILPKIKK